MNSNKSISIKYIILQHNSYKMVKRLTYKKNNKAQLPGNAFLEPPPPKSYGNTSGVYTYIK